MILTDTGAIYALIDKNDANHLVARNFYYSAAGSETFVISMPLLTEVCLLVETRLGSHFSNIFWQSVIAGVFEVLEIDKVVLANALKINKKYKGAGFGFVDATCFALCEKHKIRHVFTFDRKHFSMYKPVFTASLELLP